MSNSRFFSLANEMITEETERLDHFCNELDKKPAEKKKRIAEYKCAKYRYAGGSNIWCVFFHSNRIKVKNANSHYLIPQVDEIFTRNPEYITFYNNAPEEEKADYALYYGVKAFADEEIRKEEEKLAFASDWEKVELEERIGGMKFAKSCLDKAWCVRKDEK